MRNFKVKRIGDSGTDNLHSHRNSPSSEMQGLVPTNRLLIVAMSAGMLEAL